MPQYSVQVSQRLEAAQQHEEERSRRHEEALTGLTDRIQKARSAINHSIFEMQVACSELRTLVRRNFDESSSSYLAYVSAHERLSGALSQGIRRTASMDRILNKAQKDRETAQLQEQERKERQAARKAAQEAVKFTLPESDPFEVVYGEVVDYAV